MTGDGEGCCWHASALLRVHSAAGTLFCTVLHLDLRGGGPEGQSRSGCRLGSEGLDAENDKVGRVEGSWWSAVARSRWMARVGEAVTRQDNVQGEEGIVSRNQAEDRSCRGRECGVPGSLATQV